MNPMIGNIVYVTAWVLVIAVGSVAIISHCCATARDNKYKKSLRWWSSSCGKIEFRIPIEWAETTFHSGACDDDVFAVSQEEFVIDFTSAWNPDIVRNILWEYGAWDDEQLKDRKQNIQRLLWIACSDIAEQEEEVR